MLENLRSFSYSWANSKEWKEVKKCRVQKINRTTLYDHNWYQVEFGDVFEVAY
jgi:hypothetical protein